jgi:hypothetical protein
LALAATLGQHLLQHVKRGKGERLANSRVSGLWQMLMGWIRTLATSTQKHLIET